MTHKHTPPGPPLRVGGEDLNLRNLSKISYVWYYYGRYLYVLFSFISCYGAAHVLEGVGRERGRESYWANSL